MRSIRLVFALLLITACSSVAVARNEYQLPVVRDLSTYEQLVSRNAENRLVDVDAAVPGVVLDIRYATDDNFMKTKLYPRPAAFLRAPAARALAQAQSELHARGLGIKVYDAYRPYSVTVAMWEPIRNPDYVADPAKGSRHNRGCAVDVTLVRLLDGLELPMPTPYDDFSPRARHDFADLSPDVIENRRLLRETMERHGFAALASEWWHYDFVGWEEFDLMDIGFDEIR